MDVEEISRVLSQHEFQHLGQEADGGPPSQDYYPDAGTSPPPRETQDAGHFQPHRTLQYEPLGYAEEPFKLHVVPRAAAGTRKTQLLAPGTNPRLGLTMQYSSSTSFKPAPRQAADGLVCEGAPIYMPRPLNYHEAAAAAAAKELRLDDSKRLLRAHQQYEGGLHQGVF